MQSGNPISIVTSRLRLAQFSLRQLEKLIESPAAFTAAFGIPVVDGYRGFPEALEYAFTRITVSGVDSSWWFPFHFLRAADHAMVGLGGFKGPPDKAGMVELSYAIAPSCRNAGLATESAEGLVGWLFSIPTVNFARAHTLPGPNPSVRVLEKCGFQRVGEVEDPEDGLVWRWERARQP